MKIHWMDQPEEHDYPAALSYLSLHLRPAFAENLVKALRKQATNEFKAKDIFRASGLSLLGISNHHVKKNLEKIKTGTMLSPLLLVRDNGKLIIADGYHRMCAVYVYDEDAFIPCKIAEV